MAVFRKSRDIPSDAVILTEKEALEHQWKLVKNWEPQKDVWPFRYGLTITATASALSAIFINDHYRKKLKLLNYAKFSTFLPTVVLPVIMTSLFHNQAITNDVLIGRTQCPVCVEIRAAGIQCVFSTLYPCLIAPLAGASFATRYYTYKLPSVKQPKAVLQLWMKFTRPITNTLLGIFVFQAFVAMTVTYLESRSVFKMRSRFITLEKEYEEKHGELQ